MKTRPRATAAQILSIVAAAPAHVKQVHIAADYAELFRRVPKDGRDYFVRDPHDRRVVHWTRSDGRYERIDESTLTIKVQRRDKGTKRKRAQARLAGRGDLAQVRTTRPLTPPELCLIDLQRVTLICGFKKSFVYEREDFPRPIRLGTEQRSAVRWVEAEVLDWVRARVASRDRDA